MCDDELAVRVRWENCVFGKILMQGGGSWGYPGCSQRGLAVHLAPEDCLSPRAKVVCSSGQGMTAHF